MEKSRRQSRLGVAATLKGTSDENLPTALPVRLDAVTGHERLPAHEESQEMLRGKLRTQQADSTELSTLIEELSAHLVAIDREDQVIFVTFQTFEEVWMFATHYTLGRLGHCMELLLFDKELWLLSLENHLGIKVSVPEDTLHVLYTCVLMEEASVFARCTASRMFDSCTSRPDLYLEQGDVALFEPPFRNSGWTVLCLSDGSRGTGAKPALEPVIPFHRWFLKSCPEKILVGDGKPARDFPMLFVHNVQPSVGLRVLDSVLAALPECCATPLEGLVLNMRGVGLRCMGDLRRAAESYHAAVAICQENKDVPNRAIALANLGLLCLKAGAKGVARKHLMESVRLFSSLDGGHETTFVAVLLRLGQHWVNERRMHFGKGCYEWALLLAIKANLPDCQLMAVRRLCHFYEWESPDRARRVIYSQYQVRLLQGTPDREREGDTLEAISQLFLSLATQRAYRAALDHTKSSLAIFIDLGLSEKEAYGWLQAGKIYHLLGQAELVELYVQVALNVALSTGDNKFILKMQEAAGDIFFNSRHDQDKAIIYYTGYDGALPMADRCGAVSSRLRLCNKLAEVMFQLQLYGEALEFAHSALEISVKLGEVLNERVAYHRLASLYHRLGQCELAEHYYLKTLSLCPAPLQFDEEALYYARVYRTLGDILFYDLKDPFDAAGYYHFALAAAMDVGNKKWQLVLCTRLATLYHNFLMDRQLSLSFYKRSRGLAAELNVRRMNTAADRANVPVY
ncbi:LOW QUALITY PROTEIN: SH3 domain and tetratricopeptide repeat-containing protein 1 [Syngnathus scovelli]|uniref:LOW QUALITY PROTEIN: SH3 domain and tetratricopeptide repeat-containing protein 1 n=1 Tax=Syngnathus scovelli TaxID=161590 RepID=UPI002110A802|nr:LOW QUALITY PROTEIN: SH3 domain and tetratricopeptide repeat-containing protein 1 [Syngnathus scovelli]